MRGIGLVGCLFLSAAATTARAQQKVEFGAKAGPSFAVVRVEPDAGTTFDRRTAIGGGGFVVLPAGHNFALQFEGLLAPKGAKVTGNTPSGDTVKLLVDYFDVAVLARVNVPRSGGLHVFGGPSFGLRVRAQSEAASTFGGITAGTHQDISDQVKGHEFGLSAGAGVDVGRWIVIDGRYSWGLTNENTGDGDVRIHSRALTILAGLRFRLP